MTHDPSSDAPDPERTIGFFEKYLTIWVIACIVLGVLIGQFLPEAPEFLSRLEYAQVSLPVHPGP